MSWLPRLNEMQNKVIMEDVKNRRSIRGGATARKLNNKNNITCTVPD